MPQMSLDLRKEGGHSRPRNEVWGMWARHASPLRIGGLENPASVIDADRSKMNCKAVTLQSPVPHNAHFVDVGKKQ